MNKLNTFLAAMIEVYAFSPISANAGDIMVMEPWARASSKMAKSAAAFLVIHNNGKQADTLIAAESDMSKRTEVHESYMEKDIMMMRHVDTVVIPAGGMATLKPGGYHVMFMGLKKPLDMGTTFPLTLVFEKAGKVTVNVKVQKAGAMGAMGSKGSMDHSKMKHAH